MGHIMEKTYSPQAIEQARYQQWEQAHYFEPQGDGDPFCIMLPPPNVTGSLHMGHGFQHTLMDILTRYQRMMGSKTLWQPGTDHAGISTQLVVEGQLEAQGLSRKDMTREAFLNRMWDWKTQSGDHMTQQMRRMGSSVDWERERFTMDEGFVAAVHKVFIQLYEEGLIYRGTRLVNWDPKLGTAISDLEVVTTEETGSLWHIRYPVVDSSESLIVATTRPETLFGDVAVAVHPDDERYQHLIGSHVHLPLCDRTLPIIADTYVDPSFGTGCVKITPAHDFNDHEMAKRHQLPMINIFTKKASINKNAPVKYQAMDRFVAREHLVRDLDEAGFLVKTVPHPLTLKRGEKSHTILEPLLSDQWYVKTQPLAAPAILAVEKGDIRFVPESWNKTYYQWMNNIEDWCISRQLWWGHRIPAWYDLQGRVYVGYSENDVRFKYQIAPSVQLKQDEDVLDTWFSSALWPFATLGWPERTSQLEQFYPTSTLVTGFDIIFFWVARMIMLGLKFTGKVPFKEVLITGLVCDHEGKKMSKSKGNVLDPIDIIDGIELSALIEKRTRNLMITSMKEQIEKNTRKQFPEGIPALGTDALRFTFCSMASNTRVVRFDLNRVEGYRNFCNKLWNAARFVLLSTEEDRKEFDDGPFQYSPADQWILSRLQHVTQQAHQHLKHHRFDLLANALYEFVWHEYCDWYLEMSKAVLFDDNALSALKRGTRRTLIHVLDQSLRLLHPIIPFITEEIWQRMIKLTSETAETLMLCPYPHVEAQFIHPEIEDDMAWLQRVVQTVRNLRSEMNISPAKAIPVHLRYVNDTVQKRLETYSSMLRFLAKVTLIRCLNEDEEPSLSASSMVGELEVLIPMEGLIDAKAECERLNKEMKKLEKDREHAEQKLNNPAFIAKAPEDIILGLREKSEHTRLAIESLLTHKEKIEKMIK